MATDRPQACLMGLPLEPRMEIFHFVLHNPDIEESMHCCTMHPLADSVEELEEAEACDQRTRDLINLLCLSKAINAEIHAMRFPDWRVDFCANHKYYGPTFDFADGRIRGVWFEDWILLPEFAQLYTMHFAEERRLQTLLRFVPRISLLLDVGNYPGSHRDGGRAREMWHRVSIDTIRAFIEALNGCPRLQYLELHIEVKYDLSLEALNDYVNLFKRLRDGVALTISLEVAECLEKLFKRAPQKRSDFDQMLMKLQSPERSKHFPGVAEPVLLVPWCKLQWWTCEVFVWHSDYSGARWSNLNHIEELLVDKLLQDAWRAHGRVDRTAFDNAKQELIEMWKQQSAKCMEYVEGI